MQNATIKVTPKALAWVNGLLDGTIPHDEQDGRRQAGERWQDR
jgi:hypothetical protein